jgi:eukaryotic-like serine/threonine-protein kinase
MSSIIRIPLLFIVFVLLGLAFGFVTFKVLSFSRAVRVPSLYNMSLLEADEALNKSGLYLKIEGEDYDPKIQPGRILRQDIPAGNMVKEKRSIGVVVSKGPRVYSIPLIVNMPLGDAEEELMEKGLKIGKVIKVHSDSVGKNRIVAQKPGPDERPTGSITVIVSLGPPDIAYSCPDFTGKDLEEARQIAQKMGLTVETTGSGSVVASQKPAAGTRVRSGDSLHLELKGETGNG